MPVRAFLDSDTELYNALKAAYDRVSMPVRAFLDSDADREDEG